MSQQVTGVTRTFEAEAAMVNPFRVVRLGTSANQVNLGTTNAHVLVGINQISASASEPVTVALTGTSKVYASTGITKGAYLVAVAEGAVATATASSSPVIGIALETCAGAGLIEAMIAPSRF